jgi:hypothetical protein
VGSLFLAPAHPYHEGPETLLELLNSRVRVLPFIHAEDGGTIMIARTAITWVQPDPVVDNALVRREGIMISREEEVEVELVDGYFARGLIQMELPEDYTRLSDFLNGDDEFFPLLLEEGTAVLLGKAAVRLVRAYQPSPSLPRVPRH